MLIYKNLFHSIGLVIITMISSGYAFSQNIGYVKIDASNKHSVSVATDKMKQIKLDAGNRTLSMAVFFDHSQGGSEDKKQSNVCNLFEQGLLTFFDVRDRKDIEQKISSSALNTLANDIDFIILFSDLSFDKGYKVSKYNKKKFLWSEEYDVPEELGQEYTFKGITLNGKIIRVKDNTLLGSFMLDFVPCSDGQGCPFILKKGGSGHLLANVNTKQILLQEIDNTQDNMDEFVKKSASTIAKILKNSIQ